MVLSARRCKLERPCFPKMLLQLSKGVKYLGVILDRKLLWMKYVKTYMKRILTTYGLCSADGPLPRHEHLGSM